MIKAMKSKFLNFKVSISKWYEDLKNPTRRTVAKNKLLGFIVNILKYVLIIGLCFVILYPLILQLAVAFRAPTDVNNPSILWIPGQFSLKNFEVAMIALRYLDALKNSLILSLGVTLLQLISTSLAGYAFARLKFRQRYIVCISFVYNCCSANSNLIAFTSQSDRNEVGWKTIDIVFNGWSRNGSQVRNIHLFVPTVLSRYSH
mgnify:CR=1 FL=1